jgi:hypothetical protein
VQGAIQYPDLPQAYFRLDCVEAFSNHHCVTSSYVLIKFHYIEQAKKARSVNFDELAETSARLEAEETDRELASLIRLLPAVKLVSSWP